MADLTQQGVQTAGYLADAERKAAAYNILKNTYGADVAYDPKAALEAQQYQQNTLTNPLAVKQAQADLDKTNLDNQGVQLTNAFNAKANPLRLQGLQDKNSQSEQDTSQAAQEFPLKLAGDRASIDRANAQAGEARSATASNEFNLSTAKGAQLRSAAMGLLAGLSDTASQGGDVGAAFDRVAPQIAQYEGVSPDHLQALRAQLVVDPTGTINRMSDAIDAANQAALVAKGGAGALQAEKFRQAQAQQANALNVTAERTQAVPAATDQAQALISQMSNSAILRKARAEIPGTPEYKFEQLVKQIGTNMSLDDLRSLRASGTSLGRVTNTEFQASQNAFANLDLGQDPATLAANLRRLKSTYGAINDNIQADIKRLGASSGGKVHATAPNYITNQVYTDAKGNKAKWNGKQFVEVK